MILTLMILLKAFVIFAYLVFVAFVVHMVKCLPDGTLKRLLLMKVCD